jgi:phage tail tape-measure protein
LVGAFSFAAIGGVLKEVFNVTKSFEKYESVLTNALGSQSAAVESLKLIKDVASQTPFEVDGLTESYIKLVNR